MILASSEVPSTVSLSSWSIMGSELIKSGITYGRLPREVVGSNGWPAGSCSSLVRATNTGSPKESIRDFSSHYTLGYWWRSFKVGFRVGLSPDVLDLCAATILGGLFSTNSRCSLSLVWVRSSLRCKLWFQRSSVILSCFTVGSSALPFVGKRSFLTNLMWLISALLICWGVAELFSMSFISLAVGLIGGLVLLVFFLALIAKTWLARTML